MSRKKVKTKTSKNSLAIPKQKVADIQSPETTNKILAQETSFSGPIPPPAILQGYNQITPGLAERIVSMAEKEASHRHEIEHKELTADISDQNKIFSEARLGQICGLIIGLAAIIAGAYTATNGAQWPGGIIGGGGVIGLVSVFIYGRKQPHKPSQQNT